ncbi:MAG TPA: lysyl oxidase family protein, partial [Anaerolinea sp.]|nr:lysyl oxidase family protein [Anaerolinea sp.]
QTYLGCNRGVQGISPGWIDLDRYALLGQTVDVTNLADGYYALINYVDPDRQLWELDQENNAAMVFFRLEGGRVSTVEYEQIVCDAANCAN